MTDIRINGPICPGCARPLLVVENRCLACGFWFHPESDARSDWKYEVANGDTSLGFAEWCAHQVSA
jgi:hypothetical protein